MAAISDSVSTSATGRAGSRPGTARSRGYLHGSRARRLALAALALATLPGAMPTGTLEVRVTELRSTKGVIRLCLTADPKNFPGCTDDRNAVTRTFAAGEQGVRIAGLGRGDYAVSVIHDENNNARLDTFAGIPREGFGFSRNPAIHFGPPKFSAAEFPLSGDVTLQQVRIRYLL